MSAATERSGNGSERRTTVTSRYMISVAAEAHEACTRRRFAMYEQKGLISRPFQGTPRVWPPARTLTAQSCRLTDEGINLAGVVRILDMRREQLSEKDDLIGELRGRIRVLEDELHEYQCAAHPRLSVTV